MIRDVVTEREVTIKSVFIFFVCLFLFVFLFFRFASAVNQPEGPDSITVDANETKSVTGAKVLNISGGRIATVNLSSTTQNPRWKGFVGQVSGTFTLDDSSGSTLYDWTMATYSGEVYATRNATTPTWANVTCANNTLLEAENSLMSHTSAYDNITKTFNDTTHSEFFVGSVNITVNRCPTLNTYINNATQNTDFEEVVLTDSSNFTAGGNLIYTTIIESNVVGFDGAAYDFQMIVPEVGSPGYSSSTAYYIYVEIS